MLLAQLNLNQIRVFECVFRKRSMTAAARELHLTQSGVSQHIRTLEDTLDIRLFDRINQRLVPTPQSTELYNACSAALGSMEQALVRAKEGEKQLSGTLSIGMPIEFGNNQVVPLLSEFGAKHPYVRFALKMGFANDMNELLLKGALDFAFVDQYTMDRRIAVERICDEALELCVSNQYAKAKKRGANHDRKFFESLDYVEYQDDQPILRMWFGHHLRERNLRLNVRATVMDVQGVARFILSGFGAGVIPNHLVAKLTREGHRLQRFEGCGKPVKNTISVAYLRERSHSPASLASLEFLKNALIEK